MVNAGGTPTTSSCDGTAGYSAGYTRRNCHYSLFLYPPRLLSAIDHTFFRDIILESHVETALDDIRDVFSSCFLDKIAEAFLRRTSLSASSSASSASPVASSASAAIRTTGGNAAVLEALKAVVSRHAFPHSGPVGKNIASNTIEASSGDTSDLDINGALGIFQARASLAFLIISSRADGIGTPELRKWLSAMSTQA